MKCLIMLLLLISAASGSAMEWGDAKSFIDDHQCQTVFVQLTNNTTFCGWPEMKGSSVYLDGTVQDAIIDVEYITVMYTERRCCE